MKVNNIKIRGKDIIKYKFIKLDKKIKWWIIINKIINIIIIWYNDEIIKIRFW